MANGDRMRRGGLSLSPTQFVAMIVLVVLALLIASLVAATNDSYNLRRTEQSEQRQLDALKAKNAELKQERDRLKTDDEIERLIREKLGYIRPGEIAIVPVPVDNAQPQSTVIEQPQVTPTPPPPTKPNWEKWLDLFRTP